MLQVYDVGDDFRSTLRGVAQLKEDYYRDRQSHSGTTATGGWRPENNDTQRMWPPVTPGERFHQQNGRQVVPDYRGRQMDEPNSDGRKGIDSNQQPNRSTTISLCIKQYTVDLFRLHVYLAQA